MHYPINKPSLGILIGSLADKVCLSLGYLPNRQNYLPSRPRWPKLVSIPSRSKWLRLGYLLSS